VKKYLLNTKKEIPELLFSREKITRWINTGNEVALWTRQSKAWLHGILLYAQVDARCLRAEGAVPVRPPAHAPNHTLTASPQPSRVSSQSPGYTNVDLPACNAVWTCKQIRTFRKSIMPPGLQHIPTSTYSQPSIPQISYSKLLTNTCYSKYYYIQ
jgi:hypothetical protein